MYLLKSIPHDFMNTSLFEEALSLIIQKISMTNDIQNQLDHIYSEFCSVIMREMDQYLCYKDASTRTRKKFRNFKPYWNDQLTLLWKNMKEAEKAFLKCRGASDVKQRLRTKFMHERQIFDKALRRSERNYFKDVADEIEKINTNDPRAFWNYIKKLGPKKQQEIPMRIKYSDGTESYNKENVHTHWKNEFHTLLNNTASQLSPSQ
jgi:hypothetical protein